MSEAATDNRIFNSYGDSANLMKVFETAGLLKDLILTVKSLEARFMMLSLAGCRQAAPARTNAKRMNLVFKTNLHFVKNALGQSQYADMFVRNWADTFLASSGIRNKGDESEIGNQEFKELAGTLVSKNLFLEAKVAYVFSQLSRTDLKEDVSDAEIEEVLKVSDQKQLLKLIEEGAEKKAEPVEESTSDE